MSTQAFTTSVAATSGNRKSIRLSLTETLAQNLLTTRAMQGRNRYYQGCQIFYVAYS